MVGPHHAQCHPWHMDFIVAHGVWKLFSAGFWLNDLADIPGCVLSSPQLGGERKVLLEDKVNFITVCII